MLGVAAAGTFSTGPTIENAAYLGGTAQSDSYIAVNGLKITPEAGTFPIDAMTPITADSTTIPMIAKHGSSTAESWSNAKIAEIIVYNTNS